MLENTTNLYSAFKSKDPRFDGKFFVGISSTAIYCRPICRAKLPKPQNCTFYHTASEAEQNGYRPCLLCRPELAPGNSIMDSSKKLAYNTAKMLEKNCSNELSIEALAEKFNCTDRHLRRVFVEEYNVSPIQYLQTCRLLLAKRLLQDTNLSILDVAMASGFGSLRRFNDLFKTKYSLTPTDIRKKVPKRHESNEITIFLSYRPPYLWDKMLHFLESRAINGVELIKNNEYMRTVHLITADGKHIHGWLKVSHNQKKECLNLTISESLLPTLPKVIAKTQHLFDLHCEPYSIYEALLPMNKIKANSCTLGTRIPGCFDTFETSVRAILGQQITVKAASTLATRIVSEYGTKINTGIEGLTHTFPTAESILEFGDSITEKFGMLGVISTRSKTIQSLAQAIVNEEINFDICIDIEEEIKRLTTIKGIGDWTANYIAMRCMGWTDAFLETDVAIKKALEPYGVKEMLKISEEWKPWRSYATINLWNTI